jgi:hypothetical protein
MRWLEHIEPMGEKTNVCGILVGKLVQDHLEALGVDGRIILIWFLMKDGTKTVLKK